MGGEVELEARRAVGIGRHFLKRTLRMSPMLWKQHLSGLDPSSLTVWVFSQPCILCSHLFLMSSASTPCLVVFVTLLSHFALDHWHYCSDPDLWLSPSLWFTWSLCLTQLSTFSQRGSEGAAEQPQLRLLWLPFSLGLCWFQNQTSVAWQTGQALMIRHYSRKAIILEFRIWDRRLIEWNFFI